jgi:transposase
MLYTAAMELTKSQYQLIQPFLPRQRGNVSLSNHQVLNAILYVVEHGCKWRGLPTHFGNWHTIYTRMNRWAKRGVLDRVFVALQERQIMQVRVEAVSLDSTAVKVHPDGTGARKKTGRKPLENPALAGPLRFIWLPQMLERR